MTYPTVLRDNMLTSRQRSSRRCDVYTVGNERERAEIRRVVSVDLRKRDVRGAGARGLRWLSRDPNENDGDQDETIL